MSISEAVVLAGGEGRRCRPLTETRPKPMLPVANEPIVQHVCDTLVDVGCERIHLVVGYHGERIKSHFGPEFRGVPLEYHHQETAAGSGDALLTAADSLPDAFLVLNGDQLVGDEMVSAVREAHVAGPSPATLAATAVTETDVPYGVLEVDDDGTVSMLEDRPLTDQHRHVNAGVYAFDASVLSSLEAVAPVDGERQLTDGLRSLVDDDQVRAVFSEAFWADATYPWDLPVTTESVLARGETSVPERSAGVHVAPDAQVHDSCVLVPPVVVGSDASLGANAVVGPNVAVGENATVDAGVVVRDTVLDVDTRVGANATLFDSVLGQGVEVGRGATASGGRADVRVGATVHEDVRLGCVCGDDATVGGGVTVLEGTVVGPRARVHTGSTVDGRVGADVEVRR